MNGAPQILRLPGRGFRGGLAGIACDLGLGVPAA